MSSRTDTAATPAELERRSASGLGGDLRLAAIVDLPDGSVELPANPTSARLLRLVIGGGALFSLVIAVGFVFLTAGNDAISWPIRLLPLVVLATGDTFIWFTIKPPVLKADALEVRLINPLYGKRMARSDVALVFRGRHLQKSRGGETWDKSYLFATSDGRVGVFASASWFSDEGITEFAARLGVPVNGDFSARVKEQIDPSLR